MCRRSSLPYTFDLFSDQSIPHRTQLKFLQECFQEQEIYMRYLPAEVREFAMSYYWLRTLELKMQISMDDKVERYQRSNAFKN